jgi:phosphopentomutase
MERVSFAGDRAGEILAAAREYLNHQRRGLILLHWPDADRAGHLHGWNSPEYARWARQLDDTLGELVEYTDVLRDPETVLIACADHGGGGMDSHNHNSLHPLDQRIPLLLLGGSVRCVELPAACSLLDVPATVCWVLGVTPPASYAGRPLTHAFSGPDERVSGAMAAVA